MAGFFNSSIGQKFLMSLSGLFLMVFLLVHLGLNTLLLFDSSGELYNGAAHFMSTNPIMKVMEPILAIGFLIHILYSGLLTIQNRIARGSDKYAKFNQSKSSSWSSRNMFVLGSLIFCFLIIHLANFFWKLKFADSIPTTTINGVQMPNLYLEVSQLFITQWLYDVIYIIGAVFLGLHLHHAFWSAFQTIGFSDDKWRTRLEIIGTIYSIVVAGGFAIIPIYFFVFKNLLL